MKIELLGNGSAFNYKKTNTSYLIDDFILVDCGYNVFERLLQEPKEKLEKIGIVLITNTHSEHVGSLETFISYRWFELGLSTIVISSKEVIEEVKQILTNIGKEYDNGKIKNVKMVKYISIDKEIDTYGSFEINEYELDLLKTFHPGVKSCGFIFRDDNSSLIITGDTKATSEIREAIEEEREISGGVLVFHDICKGSPFNSVHATQEEIDFYYKDLDVNVNFVFVHDDEDKEGVYEI